VEYGIRIREIRNDLGLTQQEFGDMFNLQWHKIKDIEREKLKLTIELANEIEKKFSISGWWLLTGKGEKYLNNEISTPKPIESKEDNRDGEDFILFYDEYEFFDENPTVAVIVNTPKKVYKSNPLFNFATTDAYFALEIKENLNNFIIIKKEDSSYIQPYRFFSDSINVLRELLELLKVGNEFYVLPYIIVKNNLLKEGYPLYEDKYVGVEWSVMFKDKESFRLESTTNTRNVTHKSQIILTQQELEKLNIYAYIVYQVKNYFIGKADKNAISKSR